MFRWRAVQEALAEARATLVALRRVAEFGRMAPEAWTSVNCLLGEDVVSEEMMCGGAPSLGAVIDSPILRQDNAVALDGLCGAMENWLMID